MTNCYYSMRLYIEKFPSSINCQALLEMADQISILLGCKYDRLGYMLLHPDHDCKDVGVMLRNNKTDRERFLALSIPLIYYGKQEKTPTSPFIIFEQYSKNNAKLPPYFIQIEYPTNASQYLCMQIDIKEELLLNRITLFTFKNVQNIVSTNGYVINSAFLHYYWGDTHRTNLDGVDSGMITMNDWHIIDHAIKFRHNWKDKVMDVFYMNSINKDILSKETITRILSIVGDDNFIESDKSIFFQLPQNKSCYLLNRIFSTKSRRLIKQILQRENLCCKDPSIIASFFKL